MNLWILNQYAVAPDQPGGTRHYELGRELVRRGHDVTIFASPFNYMTRTEMRALESKSWKVENVDGVKFIWIRALPYRRNNVRRVANMLGYMFRSYRVGRKISKLDLGILRPDVVIGSSPNLLSVLSASCLAKHYRAKFIMEIRDLWPEALIDLGIMSRRNPMIKMLQVLEKSLCKRASRIITVLPFADDYIAIPGILRERIVWIPNGVDFSKFTLAGGSKEQKEQFIAMYLGSLAHSDGLNVLIDGAKIIRDEGHHDIQILLLGDGPEKPELIERKEQLRVENVQFRNVVPKKEVPSVLRKGDVIICCLKPLNAHKYGISPNKLFDSLAVGKPVILLSNAPLNIERERPYGLTVAPHNPEAFANAVIQLRKKSPEERRVMGKSIREYAQRHHDYRILAKRLENCLKITSDV